MPTFRKLWGVIDQDVNEGKYTVSILNNYDVSQWNGEKHIVLATAGHFGGKSNALAVMCLAGGFFALLSALMFGVGTCAKREKLRDQTLKW
jgi:hypothetical protein